MNDAMKNKAAGNGACATNRSDACSGKAGSGEIRERMEVIASCGTKVGVVDHIEGDAIKLTRSDSRDGQHHFIPKDWVERVDEHVHLKKNSMDTEKNWKADAASCGCGA